MLRPQCSGTPGLRRPSSRSAPRRLRTRHHYHHHCLLCSEAPMRGLALAEFRLCYRQKVAYARPFWFAWLLCCAVQMMTWPRGRLLHDKPTPRRSRTFECQHSSCDPMLNRRIPGKKSLTGRLVLFEASSASSSTRVDGLPAVLCCVDLRCKHKSSFNLHCALWCHDTGAFVVQRLHRCLNTEP